MARRARSKKSENGKKGLLSYWAELFHAADKLRKNLEPPLYKNVVRL